MTFELSPQAIGAVIAATIAGGMSFLGSVFSKDQKTSEFRQSWIDGLRSEISQLIAHANAIRGAAAVGYPDASDLYDAAKDHFVGITVAKTSILLRLNPLEENNAKVITHVNALEKLMDTSPIDLAACQKEETALVATAQAVLKSEWNRVKRGEPLFFLTKIVGLVVFLGAPLTLAARYFGWI
jgi:hypothetical protein